MRLRTLLLTVAVAGVHPSMAQTSSVPFSLWAFPGISWEPGTQWRLTAQYGYNPQWNMHAVYVQSFYRFNRYLTLNPAYLFLQRHKPALEEHTFLPAVIFTWSIGALSFDDRNLYWYRVRRQAADIHLYRNRLRVGHSFTKGAVSIKPYLYGEVFYLFNRGRWTRNRIAPGVSLDVHHRFNLDISFNRELDYFNGRSNLVFLMSTISLSRHHTTHH